MLASVIAIFLGVLTGIVTGLIPGLHVNTIAFFMLGLSLTFDPLVLSVYILSMAVTHTIVDFIPSLYLGAPEASSALSILPGHKFLLEGRGYEALLLTVGGGIFGTFFFLMSLPFLFSIIPIFYEKFRYLTSVILIWIIGFLIYGENKEKRLYAFLVVFLVSVLGFVSSYLSTQSLFLGFTGLFGISTLIYSMGNSNFPEQSQNKHNIGLKETAKGSLIGLISSVFLSVFPTIGASQAGIVSQKLSKGDDRQFLTSLGTINTIVALMSIVSLYFISRARSGAGIAIEEILGIPTFEHVLIFVGSGLIAVGLSASIVILMGKSLEKLLYKVDYRKISVFIISCLILASVIVSGLWGFVIIITSTSLGLLTNSLGLKKSHLMAFIMVPMLLFLIGI